jgi:hypothetical protein
MKIALLSGPLAISGHITFLGPSILEWSNGDLA